MELEIYEWWEAQNTEWSGGVSWFNSSWLNQRFRTREEAVGFNKRHMELIDANENILWRVVKVVKTMEIHPQERSS